MIWYVFTAGLNMVRCGMSLLLVTPTQNQSFALSFQLLQALIALS